MTSTAVIPSTTTTVPSTRAPTKAATAETAPSAFSPEAMATTAALFTSPNTSATFDASDLRDPLKMNLRRQVGALLSAVATHPDVEGRFSGVLDVLKAFVDDVEGGVGGRRVLDLLSRLLSVPELVETTVKLFRPLLVDLFARWLDGNGDEGEEVREERLVALAYVVEVYEEVFP